MILLAGVAFAKMSTQPPRVPLEDVIVQPQAIGRAAGGAAGTGGFLALSQTLANAPELALQRLVETAMKLSGAESAGVSVEDSDNGVQVFRWVATAGEFSRYLQGTMPREFSPCGTVLNRGKTLVMRDPARHYEYISDLHAPITYALLVPFGRNRRLVGTVWVLRHRHAKPFTDEDVRAVEGLTIFST